MKIYHKKSLYWALACFGYTLLVAGESMKFGWSDLSVLQAMASFCMGLECLYCAVNRKRAKKLLIEESDEMLQLKDLKVYRTAFWISFFLILLVNLLSSHFLDSPFGSVMDMCSTFTLLIMLFAYFFSRGIIYISRK